MAVNKEFLISEKELIQTRLEFSIRNFYDNPTKESMMAIFNELVYSVVYNLAFYVPVEMTDGEIAYSLERLRDIGYVYKAFTNSEELVKCAEESNVIISVRNLFKQVANDSLPGLVLNSTNENRAVVFLNKENIKRILNVALETIQAQADDVKSFLLNEI